MIPKKLCPVFLGLVLLWGAGCSSGAPCALCGGVPRSGPCVVELAAGEIGELSPSDGRSVAWYSAGRIRVAQYPDGHTAASFPAAGGEADPALYCGRCRALIAQTPNTGYVLADLHDPDRVRLWAVAEGAAYTIRGAEISAAADGEDWRVEARW